MTDDLGLLGENTAASYLLENQAKILHRNWRSPAGEIDIIAVIDDYLVFVEVKARKDVEMGHPLEAVNKRKQKTNTQCSEVVSEQIPQQRPLTSL